MTQFLFVHGVDGPRTKDPADKDFIAYEKSRAARDVNFKQVTFAGQATITNSLWSIYAAHPAWNLACVPHAVLKREPGTAPLGGIADLIGEKQGAGDFNPNGDGLANAAKADLDSVVGGLSCTAIEEATGSGSAKLAEVQTFWAAAAKALEKPEVRAALTATANDWVFIDNLQVAAKNELQVTPLGIGQDIKDAAAKLTGGIIDLVNSPGVLAVRNKITPWIAIFIGDVFTYLKAGGAREAIRNEILTKLLTAARAARAGVERLVVAGHSMGGVILYDLLSDQSVVDYLSASLGTSFKVDLFLTVGSQVALFEELKVFTASTSAFSDASGNKVTPPVSADRWWNVFNRLDVLSFLAVPVFMGVEDVEASTIAGIGDAHSAYFTNMVFYTRLNTRLKEAGLLP